MGIELFILIPLRNYFHIMLSSISISFGLKRMKISCSHHVREWICWNIEKYIFLANWKHVAYKLLLIWRLHVFFIKAVFGDLFNTYSMFCRIVIRAIILRPLMSENIQDIISVKYLRKVISGKLIDFLLESNFCSYALFSLTSWMIFHEGEGKSNIALEN